MTNTLVKRIEMSLHVQELCAKNDIQVKYVSLEEPEAFYCANRVHKIITIRPTKNTGYYVPTLHEIGHLLGPDQHQGCDRMEMEIGAWKYAVAVALVWTETATKIMKRALMSYGMKESQWEQILQESMVYAQTCKKAAELNNAA